MNNQFTSIDGKEKALVGFINAMVSMLNNAWALILSLRLAIDKKDAYENELDIQKRMEKAIDYQFHLIDTHRIALLVVTDIFNMFSMATNVQNKLLLTRVSTNFSYLGLIHYNKQETNLSKWNAVIADILVMFGNVSKYPIFMVLGQVFTAFGNLLTQVSETDKVDLTDDIKYEDVIDVLKNTSIDIDDIQQAFEKTAKDFISSLTSWLPDSLNRFITVDIDENLYLYGTDENDIIRGKEFDDFIQGLLGDDELHGYAGDDTLSGGLGNDTLNGGEGNDTLIDESGDDIYDFIGDFGHDTIYGQDGQGVIKINYQSLSAGKKLQDDIWQSSHPDYMIRVAKTQENVEGYYSLHITSKSDKNVSLMRHGSQFNAWN